MVVEPDVAAAAALFADRARAAMLSALLDRTPRSAGQLALEANVSPQSASFHLAKLASAGLLNCERHGRSHVYRLSGSAVARAIEALGTLASRPLTPANRPMAPLRAARTCYDHLAGVAGVGLHDALWRLGYFKPNGPKEYRLSIKGREWMAALDVEACAWRKRSLIARPCLDWSERRPHLAGRLAAHLLDRFLEQGWIVRLPETRAVRITQRGLRQFEKHYGVSLKAIAL